MKATGPWSYPGVTIHLQSTAQTTPQAQAHTTASTTPQLSLQRTSHTTPKPISKLKPNPKPPARAKKRLPGFPKRLHRHHRCHQPLQYPQQHEHPPSRPRYPVIVYRVVVPKARIDHSPTWSRVRSCHSAKAASNRLKVPRWRASPRVDWVGYQQVRGFLFLLPPCKWMSVALERPHSPGGSQVRSLYATPPAPPPPSGF